VTLTGPRCLCRCCAAGCDRGAEREGAVRPPHPCLLRRAPAPGAAPAGAPLRSPATRRVMRC
jgi:hypothetical protein